MPTVRALLAAAVPGAVIFADFTFWMAFSPGFALAVGLVVSGAALVVTRLLYDDAPEETRAWAEAAPDLADRPRPEPAGPTSAGPEPDRPKPEGPKPEGPEPDEPTAAPESGAPMIQASYPPPGVGAPAPAATDPMPPRPRARSGR